MISLTIRLVEFSDMEPKIVGTSGSPNECLAWVRGFLGAGGVIVDSMTTLGDK